MPANADLRQLLLTRTDLTRLEVPAARVLRWLASGSLEQIGTVPYGNETDPVFAVYSVDLQHELGEQLRELGRTDVALGPLAARSQYLRYSLQQRGIDASEVLAAQADDDGYGVPFAMRLLGSDLIERTRTEAPELSNIVDEVFALCAETAQSILPAEFAPAAESAWAGATSADELADEVPADAGADEAAAQGESWLDVDALSAGLEQLSGSGDETGAGDAVDAAPGPAVDAEEAEEAADGADAHAEDGSDVAERMARSAAEAEAVIEEAIAAVDACFGEIGPAEASAGEAAPEPMPDLLAGTFLAELAEQTSAGSARVPTASTSAPGEAFAPTAEDTAAVPDGLAAEPQPESAAAETGSHGGETAHATEDDSGEDDEDSCVASDPGIASIVRGSLASMEIDDVFAGEDAVDLDPLAGNFLADDGEDTLIDYHPHTQPAQSGQTAQATQSSKRGEKRQCSLIDPEELAALTPTEQPFVATAAATIAAELPVLDASPSRFDRLVQVVESGFEQVLTRLEQLDRLGELAKLDKLERLDALARLEKLEKLDKLDLLDKLERLDGLDALATLSRTTTASAPRAPDANETADASMATTAATEPRIDPPDLRAAIERSAAVTVAAIQALPRQLRPAPAPARSSAGHGALLFATGLFMLCWAGVLWLRSGDPWLTTAALVAANVLGCAMLAFRRS